MCDRYGLKARPTAGQRQEACWPRKRMERGPGGRTWSRREDGRCFAARGVDLRLGGAGAGWEVAASAAPSLRSRRGDHSPRPGARALSAVLKRALGPGRRTGGAPGADEGTRGRGDEGSGLGGAAGRRPWPRPQRRPEATDRSDRSCWRTSPRPRPSLTLSLSSLYLPTLVGPSPWTVTLVLFTKPS